MGEKGRHACFLGEVSPLRSPKPGIIPFLIPCISQRSPVNSSRVFLALKVTCFCWVVLKGKQLGGALRVLGLGSLRWFLVVWVAELELAEALGVDSFSILLNHRSFQ